MRDRGAIDYALVDIREVNLRAEPVQFIEQEAVPGDARVVGQAWAKSNRDGSPDRRFRDNRQIPIARYGALHFRTTTGIAEAYHVSACEKALSFGTAFHRLQAALNDMAKRPPSEELAVVGEVEPVDPTSKLPSLPKVRGAHEITALAVAAIVVFGFFATHAGSIVRPPTEVTAPDASRPVPSQVSSASVKPDHPSGDSETSQVVPPLPKKTGSGSVAPEPAKRDRLQTRLPANLRAGPDTGAVVIRVMPVGIVLDVFARDGQWVQVGQGRPWGWAHTGVLKPVP